MPLERPSVNLDAVAGVLDRVLAHPVAETVGQFMPETIKRVRAVRADLPGFFSGLEARGVEVVRSEAQAFERDMLGELGRLVDGAFRAGKRRDRRPAKKKTKRLKR